MNVLILYRNVVLFLQTNPFINSHAFLDSIKNALVVQTVCKSWLDAFSTGQCFHEIRDGVSETVFVPDDVTGRPPIVDVRVSGFGHDNIAETLSILWIARAVKFQAIHFFKIKK